MGLVPQLAAMLPGKPWLDWPAPLKVSATEASGLMAISKGLVVKAVVPGYEKAVPVLEKIETSGIGACKLGPPEPEPPVERLIRMNGPYTRSNRKEETIRRP